MPDPMRKIHFDFTVDEIDADIIFKAMMEWACHHKMAVLEMVTNGEKESKKPEIDWLNNFAKTIEGVADKMKFTIIEP